MKPQLTTALGLTLRMSLLAAGVFFPVTPHGLLAGTGASTAEFNRVWNLDKHVTVKLDKIPAVKAIAAIASQSGVAIETVGATDCCIVSVAMADVPAGQALESVAEQSGVRFEVADSKTLLAFFPGGTEAAADYPRLIHRVEAVYPKDAIAARAEGFVVVAATIGVDGTVTDVQVVRHADGWPSMDQATIDAIRQFTYTPGLEDGKPVATQIHVNMKFSVKKE